MDVVYLLRHKRYCGQSVIAECGTTKAGIKKYYYECRGRKIKLNDCKKSAIPKDLLENLVLYTTIKELSKPQIVDEIVNNLLALQDKKSKANITLNNLLKEQKQTEKALNNIVSAIELRIISNVTNKRLHELESTLQDIERRIIIEKSKTAVKTTEKEIRDYYEQALKLDP